MNKNVIFILARFKDEVIAKYLDQGKDIIDKFKLIEYGNYIILASYIESCPVHMIQTFIDDVTELSDRYISLMQLGMLQKSSDGSFKIINSTGVEAIITKNQVIIDSFIKEFNKFTTKFCDRYDIDTKELYNMTILNNIIQSIIDNCDVSIVFKDEYNKYNLEKVKSMASAILGELGELDTQNFMAGILEINRS